MSASGEPGTEPRRAGGAGAAAPARTVTGLVTAADGDRPAVTLVDPARAERTELGCATLSNWADKTANLLVEELELDPGDEIGVDIGSHWTTLVALLGAWRAGVVARLGEADPAEGPAIIHEDRVGAAPVDDDVVIVGAGMAGRHTGDVHGGLAFATDVLSMPDEFAGAPIDPAQPALRVSAGRVTHGDLAEAAASAAGLLGLAAGQRLASARPVDRLDGLVAGPLAAWTAGASLVLVVDAASLAGVAATERADTILDGAGGEALDVRCELDRGALQVWRSS